MWLIVNVIAELFTSGKSCNTHALSVGTHLCLLLADFFGSSAGRACDLLDLSDEVF